MELHFNRVSGVTSEACCLCHYGTGGTPAFCCTPIHVAVLPTSWPVFHFTCSFSLHRPRNMAVCVVLSATQLPSVIMSAGIRRTCGISYHMTAVGQSPYLCVCMQIMVAIAEKQRRPPIPPESELPGGTFPGLSAYLELMEACWHTQPSERPPFESCIITLRGLLEQAMTVK